MPAWLQTDHWQEIIGTVKQNRLRTALTAAGVFWGAFMLVAMLGFGGGLERGVTRRMSGFATNALYVWGDRTTKPYAGFQPGRRIRFDNEDVEAIRAIDGVEHVCPRDRLGGRRGGVPVRRGDEVGTFTLSGDVPAFIHVQPLTIDRGRYINQLDMDQRRKVAVVGAGVVEILFPHGGDPIGERIDVRGSIFTVVGVFRPRQTDDYGEMLRKSLVVPFSTYQSVFNKTEGVGWLAVTARPSVSVAQIEQRLGKQLRNRHRVHPDDPGGIGSWNAEEEFGKFSAIFSGISFLIWFVGVMTLLAGVIGVSNIMLIAVRERTKEIGIRRAVGASPAAIMGMIVQEAVALTAVAGYAGVVAAVFLLEAISHAIGRGGDFFAEPGVDLSIAAMSTAILVIFGVIAGITPARAALRINPVEALRME